MAKLARPDKFKDVRDMPSSKARAEIGRIAIVCASIEDILHAIHWKFAKLANPVGAVITGDLSPNRLMEDIIKIAKTGAVNARIVEDVKDLFSEYRPLATKRNQCLHWTWNRPKGGTHVVEPPPYKIGQQQTTFTLPELKKLTMALMWVEARLDAHSFDDAELAKERDLWKDEADVYVPTPWLDTPPQQAPKRSPRSGAGK